MPSKTEKSTSAADAAVAEATEQSKSVTFPFRGQDYTFKAKRRESMQFRLLMQNNRDLSAFQWLLGPGQFQKFLEATADEDGCTPLSAYMEFLDALGEAGGSGNS